MKRLAIVLLSGGLDSMLAARVLQEQGVAVEGLKVQTPFDASQQPAIDAARELGVSLTIRRVEEDYVELLRRPQFGYGKAVNPCLDCHLYMAKMARRVLDERGACVVASGEVLGQRPMSQKRQDLNLIARRSGLEGRLLRPLSAKRLDPTIAELEGWINRERLYDFAGRGRRPLMELAGKLGLHRLPERSPGCALTTTTFAPRVHDLFHFNTNVTLWDCDLLRIGRHFRIDPLHKVVLGRDAEENAALSELAARADAVEATLVEPRSFIGPRAMLCGPATGDLLQAVVRLMIEYTRQADSECREALVCIQRGQTRQDVRL